MVNVNFNVNIKEIGNGFIVSGNIQKVTENGTRELYKPTINEAVKVATEAFEEEVAQAVKASKNDK